MSRSMQIDIGATHAALLAQNGKLKQSRAHIAKLKAALSFDSAQLAGQGYDVMRRYCQNELIPLTNAIIEAMDAQLDANNAYRKAMYRYLPSIGRVSVDELIRQRESIERQINALEGKKGFFSSFPGTSIIVDQIDAQIAPLVEVRSKICKRINDFLDFLEATSATYDTAKERKSTVNRLVAAAQKGWSPGVGFSAAYKVSPVSNGVPLWSDRNDMDINEVGDPRTYRYINGVKTEYGSVRSHNYDGSIACTYYTLTRLRERGLDFPFLGSGHAKTWFKNCDLDSQYKAEWDNGQNPIEVLLDRFGYAELTNVVIVFPGAGSTSETGHVLLIDRVYRDANGVIHVVWSDIADPNNGKPPLFNRKTRSGDEDPPVDRTLQQFMDLYPSRNYGTMTGAILFGSSS